MPAFVRYNIISGLELLQFQAAEGLGLIYIVKSVESPMDLNSSTFSDSVVISLGTM